MGLQLQGANVGLAGQPRLMNVVQSERQQLGEVVIQEPGQRNASPNLELLICANHMCCSLHIPRLA